MAQPELDERLKRLGEQIEAARAAIAHRDEFEGDDIGGILEAINEDVEGVSHEDAAKAHADYDALEARLAAVRGRLDARAKG